VNASEVFLGVIAVAVLAMAIGHVMAVVFVTRAMKRLGEAAGRFEQDMKPVVQNVQAMSADAAKATALAAGQVERADRLLNDAARRLEETMTTVQKTILGPARDGLAILSGIKAAFVAIRDLRAAARRRPSPTGAPVSVPVPDPGDEDHASFIG
jgi:hypothetical protein